MPKKEYIERVALIKFAMDYIPNIHGDTTMKAVKRALKAAPAADDVVEVVRCKDCEYCRISIDPKTKISVQVFGYVGYNPIQSSQVLL